MNRERKSRQLDAVESASRLLAELDVDQTRRIDVFGLCEQVGLWLAFFPLDGLLGSYLPEGSGGVIITTRRPVSVQRYTAAHELGHWRLRHGEGSVLVSEEQILGDTPGESEQLAQVFAAAVLMPPPLVFSTLKRLGSHSEEMSSVHAYEVARAAGVSYEAAVRQLANLEIIDGARASELLKIKPLKIKTLIGRGHRPVVGTADVWPVDERWHGQQLRIHADDEVVISLPENRSTGYRWFFEGHTPPRQSVPEPPALQPAEPYGQLALVKESDNFVTQVHEMNRETKNPDPTAAVDRALAATGVLSAPSKQIHGSVEILRDRYFTARVPAMSSSDARYARLARIGADGTDAPPASEALNSIPAIGGTGQRVFNVRFRQTGINAIRLNLRSAYSDNSEDTDTYALEVVVEPRRHGLSIEQLLAASDPDWI